MVTDEMFSRLFHGVGAQDGCCVGCLVIVV